MNSRYEKLLPIINNIIRLKESNNQILVALDGRAASGKSTAAGLLAEIFDAEVIHMDDFYLPTNLRTQERYAEPGGNVHYERFKEEVIEGIRSNQEFSYGIFDCSILDFGKSVVVKPKQIYIIEGAYSMHPYFGEIFDLKCFFHINPEEQKNRIIHRNGEAKLLDFQNKWIPFEENYLTKYDIKSKCDLIIQ